MIRPRKTHMPWWRRLLRSRLMIAANLLLLGFVGWSLVREASSGDRAAAEYADLEKRISELEQKNKNYSSVISRLGTAGFVEREARLKLGYQMPGEGVIMLRDPEAALRAEAMSEKEGLSNPQKWWRYFFGSR